MAIGIRSKSIAISSSFSSSYSCSSSSRSSYLRRCNGINSVNCRRRSPLRLRASSDSGSLPVEVIGIGSRKDAVLDFCLSSPMISSSRLRFWTVHMRDSKKVQLLQRYHGTEMILKDVEFPRLLLPCTAIILVASAGPVMDHVAAMELLNSVKSAGGLAVSILLKPFSFEGQRRMEEVDGLVDKLQKFSNLYIVVEADSLLKAEMETLAVALDSMNNVVFLAIHTISVLMSEVQLKMLNTSDGQMKKVEPFEVLQLLGTDGEAKVGFGAGFNLRSAVMQAIYHCPIPCGELKEFNGVVIFTLTSSSDMDERDFQSAVLSFRQFTECTGDIIFSRIHEPKMEPNLIVATLLIAGCKEKRVSQKKSFLSGLALRFPFLHSFFGRNFSQPTGTQSAYSHSIPSVGANFPTDSQSKPMDSVDDAFETKIEDNNEHSSRESSYGLVTENTCQSTAVSAFHREQDSNFSLGPGFHIAQLWAKERADFVGSNQIDMPEVFTLPVGVKSSSEICSDRVEYSQCDLPGTSSKLSIISHRTAAFPSKDELPDTGLEAISDIYDTALTLLKKRNVDERRKRGLLSERAASMLESERDLPKSWTRVMEMQYRGGIFRGRCQGGLPEGKGCLTFTDGSFYDGMWRYGKRSGVGTFCYSNGDVFQGSWRDDLMNGKGWFYFHNGDRWFANFWKGKANGEGRYYSNDGSNFFGCFQNGWRHGEGLCINVDGSRWTELWKEGILVSRTLVEKGHER